MASLPLIEIVKRQAIATFTKLSSNVSTSFEDNLSKLKSVMNKITSADVNLDTKLLQPVPDDMEKIHPPVTYIEVLEDPSLTIGIFVLKQGARIPLHDHPLMYGLLKVIHGTVNIQSYSVVTEENIPRESLVLEPDDIGLSKATLYREVVLKAKKEPAFLLNERDNVCVLSPITGNFHEIHSVNGPAAFLDVLSPPYDTDIPGVGPRPCRYFKELDDVPENDSNERPVKRLLRISSPSDYWSSSAPYQGP